MPSRNPRRQLVSLLLHLEARPRPVTLKEIERAAARRCPRTLPPAVISLQMHDAANDLLILMDRRMFFDRKTRMVTEKYVYRVNRRHPVARELVVPGQ